MTKLSPPALTARSFDKLMDLLQYRKAGEALSRDYLVKKAFSSHAARGGLAALTFLGMLDEEGNLTGDHRVWYGDGDLGELLARSYGDFHGKARDGNLEDQEAQELLAEAFGLNERVCKTAWTFYKHCRNRMDREAGGSMSKEKSKDKPVTTTLPGGAQVVFSLQVTKHTSEKDIVKMLRTVDKATFQYNKKFSGTSSD